MIKNKIQIIYLLSVINFNFKASIPYEGEGKYSYFKLARRLQNEQRLDLKHTHKQAPRDQGVLPLFSELKIWLLALILPNQWEIFPKINVENWAYEIL